MGMTGNTSPFGQPFSQTGGQQMGATGVNPQLPTKPGMANSLSAFPTDIKSTPVTSVPNMVSCILLFPWVAVYWSCILNSGAEWPLQHYWTSAGLFKRQRCPRVFHYCSVEHVGSLCSFLYSNFQSKQYVLLQDCITSFHFVWDI